MTLSIEPSMARRLVKAQYGLYKHGALEICHWTKKALRGRGGCYKGRFYGIDTWRCMELTPVAVWCTNNCIFCWRPMELFRFATIREEDAVEPEELLQGLTRERERLLSGFGGNPEVSRERFEEALVPSHYAISLAGEPTMYPKLPELIRYIRHLPQTKSIFLVSNGLEPDMLRKMQEHDALPTQLYLSLNAPSMEAYRKICLPEYRDAWARFLESLDLLQKLKTRRVLRLTLIKGLNMLGEYIEGYSDLIQRGMSDFVEVKAYMHIGDSIRRLERENMPSFDEVRAYTERLLSGLHEYRYDDASEESRVVLLSRRENSVPRTISAPL